MLVPLQHFPCHHFYSPSASQTAIIVWILEEITRLSCSTFLKKSEPA